MELITILPDREKFQPLRATTKWPFRWSSDELEARIVTRMADPWGGVVRVLIQLSDRGGIELVALPATQADFRSIKQAARLSSGSAVVLVNSGRNNEERRERSIKAVSEAVAHLRQDSSWPEMGVRERIAEIQQFTLERYGHRVSQNTLYKSWVRPIWA